MSDFVFSDVALEKLKKIEVEMLKEVISVCDTLKIKYYLIGGTLLGAVRHKGFIPWDDDIDIAMTRADYEKFIKAAPALLPKNLFVQTNKSEQELLANFAKIRNCDTTFIETSVKNLNINHGVFVDIFPLDIFCDGKLSEKMFLFTKHCLRLRIEKGFCLDRIKRSSFVKRAVNKVLSAFLFWVSPERGVKLREKLFTYYKKGSRLANHSGAWGKKEIVPADWYGDGVFLEFEGISVRCPKEYDKWLTRVYGDYMKLPPLEKRISHHFVEVVDLDKSYKEYI